MAYNFRKLAGALLLALLLIAVLLAAPFSPTQADEEDWEIISEEHFGGDQPQDWELGEGCEVEGGVLVCREPGQTRCTKENLGEVWVTFRLVYLNGDLDANVRVSDTRHYAVRLHREGYYSLSLSLFRCIPPGIQLIDYVEVNFPEWDPNTWVEIIATGSDIQVKVNNEYENIVVEHTETEPLPPGDITFEALYHSEAYVDDIFVRVPPSPPPPPPPPEEPQPEEPPPEEPQPEEPPPEEPPPEEPPPEEPPPTIPWPPFAGGAVVILVGTLVARQAVRSHRRREWQEKAEEETSERCQPGTQCCHKAEVEFEPGQCRLEQLTLLAKDPASGQQLKKKRLEGDIADELNESIKASRRGEGQPDLERRLTALAERLLEQIMEWLRPEPAPRDVSVIGHLEGCEVTYKFSRKRCQESGTWGEPEEEWELTVKEKRQMPLATLAGLKPATEVSEQLTAQLASQLTGFIGQV